MAGSLALRYGLAACSSPDPDLYTIAPVTGADARPAAPKVIALQQIGLARYLDRTQIVRSSENYRLDVMSNDWWGEPLGAMLSRVLVEELGQRLPHSIVYQRERRGIASARRHRRAEHPAARPECRRHPRVRGAGGGGVQGHAARR